MSNEELVEEVRDSARDFLRRRDHRQRKRRGGEPDRGVWREIAEMGWLGMTVPEDLGGLDVGWHALAAVMEEAGRAQLPEPLLAAGVLPAAVLSRLRDEAGADYRRHLLTQICEGSLLVGLAWQESEGQLEPGESSSAFGVSATPRDSAYVLNGEKRHVMPGAGVDGWLVSVDSEHGPALYYVAAGAPGVNTVAHTRADGSPACHLSLESVTPQALLARQGVLEAIDTALDLGRLMQSAEMLGAARQVLADSVVYLNTRQQFGKALAAFQALQHRVVDAAMQIELGANSLRNALKVLQAPALQAPALQASAQQAPALRLAASRVKARAAQAGLGAARLAIQLHGAIGYTDECDVSLYFRNVLHHSAWLGNVRAHRQRYGALAPEPVLANEAHPKELLASEAQAEGLLAREAQHEALVPRAEETFARDADWNAMPEDAFRAMLRRFFQANYPAHLRNVHWRLHWNDIKEWYFTLSRQGWIAPSWPREHGGMGLTPARLIAYIEEAERYGVARAPDQGLVMLGPILLRYGTAAQRERFLPGILSGGDVWAQGYSEPNAGSDLAALRCEATIDGDDLVVNGQKTWSTLAQDATHMFMLVRTDKTVKKQAGISFLLVDLRSHGVSRRPIRTLSGHEEFCEVFFDQVRVPRANLVGGLNEGWGIAKALLGYERLFSGSPKHATHALVQIYSVARQRGLLADAAFVDRLAELRMDTADLGAMYEVFADMARSGRLLPPELSLLKIWATETHERLGALLIQACEEDGGGALDASLGKVHPQAPYINALAATIFSGTNEIQRNLYAKQVLGLQDS